MFDVIIIGGGAAGIFASLVAKETFAKASVVVLEKSNVLLSKVRISGGGRCNVTHNCFLPNLLCENYPRGRKELLSCFHRFQPRDMIDWLNQRGVELVAENDGRIFPATNRSQTIIDVFLKHADALGVERRLMQAIDTIDCRQGVFHIVTRDGVLQSRALILATGSSKAGWKWASELGHAIVDAAPSLFTFNVPDSAVKHLSGVVVKKAQVSICGTPHKQTGPLLITHFGFSGPCALKLSAFAARELQKMHYKAELSIDWLPDIPLVQLEENFKQLQQSHGGKVHDNTHGLPKNLWKHQCLQCGISKEKRWKECSRASIFLLAQKLKKDLHVFNGKTTHKEEFVTAGGVSLKEVDVTSMQSKIVPSLFFAGEVLDVDGITGGFNFQNAWTSGFLAGTHCLKKFVEEKACALPA